MIKIKGEPQPKTVVEARALRKAVTKLERRVTKPKGGRPKRYETAADRQKAYRARKKADG